MFVVKFTGGLGNQIYIYAVYLWLRRRYPDITVKADIDRYIYEKYKVHNGFELTNVFKNIDMDVASTKEILKCGGEYERHRRGIIDIGKRQYYRRIRGVKPIGDDQWDYLKSMPEEELKKKNLWLNLWWNIIEDGIFPDLEFAHPLTEANKEMYDKMSGEDSVSVHVRRGDYLGTSMDVVRFEYYERAMDYCRKIMNSPHFYVFSDDKDYICSKFSGVEDCTIVDKNKGNSSYIDMQLMSYCKNNIITNSTFSSCAALLNRNLQKTVIGPKGYLRALPITGRKIIEL